MFSLSKNQHFLYPTGLVMLSGELYDECTRTHVVPVHLGDVAVQIDLEAILLLDNWK